MRSSNEWYAGGQPCSHSRLVLVNSTIATSYLDANNSQIMNIINITAVKPTDGIVVHVVYASG